MILIQSKIYAVWPLNILILQVILRLHCDYCRVRICLGSLISISRATSDTDNKTRKTPPSGPGTFALCLKFYHKKEYKSKRESQLNDLGCVMNVAHARQTGKKLQENATLNAIQTHPVSCDSCRKIWVVWDCDLSAPFYYQVMLRQTQESWGQMGAPRPKERREGRKEPKSGRKAPSHDKSASASTAVFWSFPELRFA